MNLRRLIKRKINELRNKYPVGYYILNKRNRRIREEFKKSLGESEVDFNKLTSDNWCNHRETVVVYPRTTILGLNPHRVIGCIKCGLEFTEKIPSLTSVKKPYKSEDYYFRGSLPAFDNSGKPLKEWLLSIFVRYIEALKIDKYVNEPKRYLEIGCGVGFTVAMMRDWGFDSYGVEISDWAVDYMKNELKIKNAIRCDDLKEAKFPDNFFGFIHMGHTIEHLINPIDTLKEIYRILAPDGVLFLITPDVELDDFTYYIKEHFYFFSEYALLYWLRVIGFRNIEIHRDMGEKHILEGPCFLVLAKK